jgi:hypothetical protein
MQVEAYGGLSSSTKKRLEGIAAGVRQGNTDVAGIAKAIRPGAQMLRQWRGQTHTVTAVHEGFEWNGKTYKSLSAVARQITGTNWNGYAFFGIMRAPPGLCARPLLQVYAENRSEADLMLSRGVRLLLTLAV